jgi:hypothetical protein
MGRPSWAADALAFAGVAGFVGGDRGVVGDDEDVVLGDGEIEFEDVDAVFDGVAEGGKCVFGAYSAGAAMAVDEDLLAGHGGDQEEVREKQGREERFHEITSISGQYFRVVNGRWSR